MDKVKTDTAYYKGQEPTPEVEACLMHPAFKGDKRIEFGPRFGFEGGVYLLCNLCVKGLEDPNYQTMIDAEIKRRLKNLKRSL